MSRVVKHEPEAQWGFRTIEELVEDGRAIGYGVLKPGVHVEGGIRLIKSNQVRDGFVDLSDDYRISPDLDEQFKRTRLRGGELLLNVVGSIGRSAIAPSQLAGANVSRAIAVLPLDKKHVHWVQLFLSSPQCQAEMLDRKVGIAQPVLNLGQVRKLTVPIPPLAVQELIVAEVEKQFTRLEAGVAALHRVQANLKRYRAAILKAACEGRLVPTEAELAKAEGRTCETGEQFLARILADRRKNWHGRGKYKEPAAPDTTNLPPLPEGWAWATVEQLNLADRPCAYGVLQPGDDIEGGVPFVRVGDISDGKVDQSNLKRIRPSIAAKYPRTKLQGGELVITLVGAIGRTAIVPASLERGNVARAVGVVPLTPQLNRHWVEIWFRNPQKVTEMTSKSHEVARKTLNLEDVRAASVAVPPLTEQTRIVAEVERRLSVIEELEATVVGNLHRAARLRQSILHRAFDGGQ